MPQPNVRTSEPKPKQHRSKSEAINVSLPPVSSYPPPDPDTMAAVRWSALEMRISDAEVQTMMSMMFGVE